MSEEDVRQLCLHRLGLRIEPHMSRYILKHLPTGATASRTLVEIPVMGGNARTGAAVWRLVPLRNLLDPPAAGKVV